MNGEDKQRILNSTDKGISTTKLNAPAQMFRRLLVALKIDGRAYDQLIRAYLERTSSSKDPVTLASDRGNLNKALLSNKISWKTFMRGVEMLTIVNMKITVHVQLPTKKWVSVETDEMNIRNMNAPIFEQPPLDLDNTEVEEEEDEL